LSKTTTTRKKTAPAAKRKPAPVRTAVEALEKYEDALKIFRRGEYDKAIPLFEKIAASYPMEREIADRSQMWITVARGRTAPEAPRPKNAEEHHDRGVMAANEGRLEEAAEHFRSVATMSPETDRGHYGLASVCALRGDVGGAMKHLAKAIEVSPSNRIRALNDVDFDALREDAEFMALLGRKPEDNR